MTNNASGLRENCAKPKERKGCAGIINCNIKIMTQNHKAKVPIVFAVESTNSVRSTMWKSKSTVRHQIFLLPSPNLLCN